MASSEEYLAYVLEQLSDAPDVAYRKMMGGVRALCVREGVRRHLRRPLPG